MDSSSIATMGYDAAQRLLDIEFRKNRRIYRYLEVPADEYAAFLEAKSKGRYLNQQFKRAGYKYIRLR